MKKINLLLLIPTIIACSYATAQTSKACNLEIKIETPINDSQYAPYDTAFVNFKIINHGPDDITPSDTIHFAYELLQTLIPTYCLPTNILAGDFIVVGPYAALYASSSQQENDTETICAFLLNTSATYNDFDNNNDTADCVTFIIEGNNESGISDLSSKNPMKLKIYPNPATSEITIPLGVIKPSKVRISLKDILGRTLFQQNYNQASIPSKTVTLDVSGYRPGVYFVELNADGKKFAGKLVIQ